MLPCNRMHRWTCCSAGVAFLISALVSSFWISFCLGALLLCLGFFLTR